MSNSISWLVRSHNERLLNRLSEVTLYELLLGSEYSKHAQLVVDDLEICLYSLLKDCFGRDLFKPGSLQIILSDEIETAIVTQDKRGGSYFIVLGLSYIRMIEVLSLTIFTESSLFEKIFSEDALERELSSKELDTLQREARRFGIFEHAQIAKDLRIAATRFSRLTDPKSFSVVSVECISALLWAVFHEVAHIVCGHLGRSNDKYGRSGTIKYSAKNGRVDLKSINDANLQEFRRDYLSALSQEFMADKYATFRLVMALDELFHRSPEFDSVGLDSFNRKAVFASAGAIPLTLLVGKGRDDDQDRSVLEGTGELKGGNMYPSEFSRFMVGSLAGFFALYPLTNAFVPLPNLFTKTLFASNLKYTSQEAVAAEWSQGFYVTWSHWHRLGLLTIDQASALANDLHIVWAHFSMARVGAPLLGNYEMQEAFSAEARRLFQHCAEGCRFRIEFWESRGFLYVESQRNLTTWLNVFFANNIPDEFFALGIGDFPSIEEAWNMIECFDRGPDHDFEIDYKLSRRILENSRYHRDPAFQLLDNWMSQMQYYFSGDRYGEDHCSGAHYASFEQDVIGSLVFGMKVRKHIRLIGLTLS